MPQAGPKISIDKLAIFGLVTVIGSLLQLWIVILILKVVKNQVIDVGRLLGDGGLLFFATALFVAAAVLLSERGDLAPGKRDLTVSLIMFLLVFIPAVVIYSSVIPDHVAASPPPAIPPFADLIGPQLACGFGALAFAVYAGARAGKFEP